MRETQQCTTGSAGGEGQTREDRSRADGAAGTCLTKHRFLGDAWS